MSYLTYEVRVYENGTKKWYLNDELHREDGPAIECCSGTKHWYLNDELHRIDGPAIERSDGTNHWYLNGTEYTEEEFNKKMSLTVEMTIAEIEELVGKKVKVIK